MFMFFTNALNSKGVRVCAVFQDIRRTSMLSFLEHVLVLPLVCSALLTKEAGSTRDVVRNRFGLFCSKMW